MNMLKGDFHIHTKYSIEPKFGLGMFEIRALYGSEKLIQNAISKNLNVISITDHDTLDGAILGERFVKKERINDFTFLKGEEISTDAGHLLGVGIEEAIKPGLSVQETADRIKEQGGLVIVPHPYTPYGIKDCTLTTKGIDAIEVFNPQYWYTSFLKFQTGFYPKLAKLNNFAMVANTDAHTLRCIGTVFTEIKSEHGIDNIIHAIKKHRTKYTNYTSFLSATANVISSLSLLPMSWRSQAVL